MSLKDEIYRDWGTIYKTEHRRKAHLYPDCRRIKNKDTFGKEIAVYPKSHIEFCTHCKNYYKRWKKGLEAGTDTCARCGTPETETEYCESCRKTIAHRKAQKR